MKKMINRKDIYGVQLYEGDIVAESTVGKKIWGGKGIVKARPLGLVVTYPSMNANPEITPEETDRYNIMQIRKGFVELTDESLPWLNDGDGTCELNITRFDGGFSAWDNIEKIGSVYELDIKELTLEATDKILKRMENEKTDPYDYVSTEDRKLVRHWNNCIDVCKEIIKDELDYGRFDRQKRID